MKLFFLYFKTAGTPTLYFQFPEPQSQYSLILMNLYLGFDSIGMTHWAPFYCHGLTLMPAWISNYIHF